MRTSVLDQLPLVPQIDGHSHMEELVAMSEILDRHRGIAQMVLQDLLAGVVDPDKGRQGLSGEQTLRALVVKQLNSFSYEELAFHLADSLSYRAFCRFGFDDRTPGASCLQSNIKKIRPETLEAINRFLVVDAEECGVDDGRKVRTDCTVMESNIHEPSDSSLLWDCVRVLTRHLHRLADAGLSISFSDHTRRAKRRHIGINNAKTKSRRSELYRDLIKVTERTLGYAERAVLAVEKHFAPNTVALSGLSDFYNGLRHYVRLTKRVLEQTRRRILDGESVPATEKIVSIFESHTEILVKDRRETLYGHKLCFTAGASGLIVDCVIEDGNPADSTLAVRMIERHIEQFGYPPRQAAFDGGFTSKDNLNAIKTLGVEDVCFSKRRGLDIPDMVRDSWTYRQLKRFRAGIESIVSWMNFDAR